MIDVPEIQYEKDSYSDILKTDGRFDSRAYDFVLEVIRIASEDAKGHVSGHELLCYFRDLALDAYGPLASPGLQPFARHRLVLFTRI